MKQPPSRSEIPLCSWTAGTFPREFPLPSWSPSHHTRACDSEANLNIYSSAPGWECFLAREGASFIGLGRQGVGLESQSGINAFLAPRWLLCGRHRSILAALPSLLEQEQR